MSLDIRDLSAAELPAATGVHAEAVRNGTASYELLPADVAEMTTRFRALKEKGYPYLTAVDAGGQLLGYAYASAFRPRPA